MYSYPRTNWQNSPSKSTPINATRLNNIEQGITSVASFTEDSTYNMLNYPFDDGRTLVSGITITENNGKIALNGTATDNIEIMLTKGRRLTKGIYTISGCISTGGDDYNIAVYDTENSEIIGQDEGAGDSFSVAEDTTVNVLLRVSASASLSASNLFSPCLTKGNDNNYYVPFSKGNNLPEAIKWYVDDAKADNYVPFPYNTQSGSVVNGITWIVNDDGTITANGTATADSNFYCVNRNQNIVIDGGEYTLSGAPSNMDDKCSVWSNYTTSTGGTGNLRWDYGEGVTGVIPNGIRAIGIYCTISRGTTVNNIVFKPMLEKGSVKHNYKEVKYSKAGLRRDIDAILAAMS